MAKRSPILGYNHNVRYRGLIFHVQTEDSGVLAPHLFTHLFHSGVIVSTRKYVYDSGSTEEAIKSLMQAQHKAVMKELRRGSFDDKIDSYLGETPGLLPRGSNATAEEVAEAAAAASGPVRVEDGAEAASGAVRVDEAEAPVPVRLEAASSAPVRVAGAAASGPVRAVPSRAASPSVEEPAPEESTQLDPAISREATLEDPAIGLRPTDLAMEPLTAEHRRLGCTRGRPARGSGTRTGASTR